jgi:hypothetical protein
MDYRNRKDAGSWLQGLGRIQPGWLLIATVAAYKAQQKRIAVGKKMNQKQIIGINCPIN